MLTSPQTIIAAGALYNVIDAATRQIDKFYNPALTLATDMLFPKSKRMYKYKASSRSRQISPHMLGTTLKHPTHEGQTGVCTNDTSATRHFSSHMAMPGCVNTSTCEAEYIYLSLNFATEGTRAFLLDSWANNPLMKMTDFSQGTLRSITPANKYDFVYADTDAEEISERDYKLYHLLPQAQAMAHLAKFGGDKVWMNHFACNFTLDHFYHPWAQETPGFLQKDTVNGMAAFAKSGDMKTRSHEKRKPSDKVPEVAKYYSAAICAHTMPNVVARHDPIQSMRSYASMDGMKAKASKMSVYKQDLMTVDECKKSQD
jgi:hypothetical protein